MRPARFFAPLLLLFAAGCALPPEPAPLTTADVVARHKAGAVELDLVREIEFTGSRFYLTVADVLALREAGVPDPVIDRMLQTAWRPERVYYVHGDPWFHDPYWRSYRHPRWPD